MLAHTGQMALEMQRANERMVRAYSLEDYRYVAQHPLRQMIASAAPETWDAEQRALLEALTGDVTPRWLERLQLHPSWSAKLDALYLDCIAQCRTGSPAASVDAAAVTDLLAVRLSADREWRELVPYVREFGGIAAESAMAK